MHRLHILVKYVTNINAFIKNLPLMNVVTVRFVLILHKLEQNEGVVYLQLMLSLLLRPDPIARSMVMTNQY